MREAISRKKEPVEELITAVGVHRFFTFLKKRWWIPVLTALFGLGGEWVYIYVKPPGATVVARMLVGGKVRIPEGGLYAEEWQNFFGTQVELMQSDKIRNRTLDRLQRLRQNRNASPVRL